ncbi:MAG: DUF4080 domain-containing protein [Candidatus Lambdaproteobacteria bacterium]|nr:DUF4080 domain-containing protein [Candidatus Lambdaproteobacteria bacterium]
MDASIGLVTINASWSHLALALRYLRNAARAAGFTRVWLREFTLKTPLWKMAAEIMAGSPRLLGFSVYIWNREETFALIELVKKQNPAVTIVVGGPEVSFEAGPPSPYIDEVIAGEGETKWVELLRLWAEGRTPDVATRARWRSYGSDLPALAEPPYRPEDYAGIADRLAYVETSRGCPYTCTFCLSALDERVRFFHEPAVRRMISELVAAGARRIKFLDRTFNLRKARVRELFRWLAQFEGVQFHFEIVGDLLDEELLALLEQVPPGMFQFEVGIQTADATVQSRIRRRQDTERLFAALRRLRAAGRVHLHADLIWGLPGETLAQIRASFEQALALRPHELQLGFLKFLPGAPIRALIEAEGYVFQDRPPYEVIAHKALPAHEVSALKRFEEVFDLYYNSGRFRFTLERLFRVESPWAVFAALAGHFAREGLLLRSHGLEALSRHLLACGQAWLPRAELTDLLKLDYFYHHRARRVPAFLRGQAARESETVRALRKADPRTALVAFAHEVELGREGACLTPSADSVWYGFTYPEGEAGYFFRPLLHRVG